MTVSPRRYANAVVLSVAGRLDQDTCDDFRLELMKHVEQTARDGGAIVLDLGGLEYVSSAGLRCFMLASRQAKSQHGRILVASLQPMVAEIFEISHFNLVFQVLPTVREALGATSSDALAAYEKA
ncbi:Putative anti-sigma factor antagonist BtrV [Usitatibacter rugosus]|uniref:Anti-sigma factor antagonist n=1 Tax=Usitatibacter rugosus TaxID=2732067 RepID=A0A6M4H019_9PROT|nr:STAS domain-containing protein [Usitatibacter rugosus]QJR12840.1 Putative anti-sigma factor antagonist BtrV [Usitatibacter rugosus]